MPDIITEDQFSLTDTIKVNAICGSLDEDDELQMAAWYDKGLHYNYEEEYDCCIVYKCTLTSMKDPEGFHYFRKPVQISITCLSDIEPHFILHNGKPIENVIVKTVYDDGLERDVLVCSYYTTELGILEVYFGLTCQNVSESSNIIITTPELFEGYTKSIMYNNTLLQGSKIEDIETSEIMHQYIALLEGSMDCTEIDIRLGHLFNPAIPYKKYAKITAVQNKQNKIYTLGEKSVRVISYKDIDYKLTSIELKNNK